MIVLGRIVAPFGIQGWVKVHPFGDDPLSWRKMRQWWVAATAESEAGAWRPLSLKACRAHGKGLLVAAFEEVENRAAAEALDGWFIGAPREALPQPAEGEYYWADLVGLVVINKAGVALGTVRELMDTGAHAVLVVEDGEAQRLIPFVATYVGEVDIAGRRVEVDWEADW